MDELRPRRPRRALRRAFAAGGVLAFLLVLFWLRPESLGGSTGFAIVGGESMKPALRSGDLVVVRRRSSYAVGDVVDYRVPSGEFKGRQIIHRIVGGSADAGYEVRGDNKADPDLWRPRPGDIVGEEWIRVPFVGRVLAFLRAPPFVAAVVSGIVFALVFTQVKPEEDEPKPEPEGALSH